MDVIGEAIIALPRQHGPVRVRAGSLDENLDRLHEQDPKWWGKAFVADRVASMPDGTPYLMLAADIDGELAGDASLIGLPIQARGHAMAELWVDPQHRGRGVGRALAEALAEATCAYGLPGLSGTAVDDDERTLAVARRWGAELAGHHHESVLDLAAFDVPGAQAVVARAEEAGHRLEPLPPDADEQTWRVAFDLYTRLLRDTPDAAGADEDMPYSVFRGFHAEPWQVLVAWSEDVPAGITTLVPRDRDQAVNIFFTGVERAFRGRSLSTALQAAQALLARDRGEQRIYTQNMDQNARILTANERLGYRRESGYYDLALQVPWPERHTRG